MMDWNVEEVVKINSPLAIQLAYDWLKTNKLEKLNGIKPFVVDGDFQKILPTVEKILQNFQFPGRFQYLKIKNLK